MSDRVLITGGAGFIGHHLGLAWLTRGAEVTVLDNFRTGRRDNIARLAAAGGARFRFVEGSITDPDAVADAIGGARYVHHLAAQVSVPESVERPRECVDINVNGLLTVLDAARAAGVDRVVFSSSAAVYGDDPRSPKTEDMTPAPKSPYGITKLDGEHYLKMYAALHGVGCVSLRYFNVFGPRQDPRSVYAAAVPIFIERALAGRDITIFGDGEQTRDFVFVEDVAAANILAATSTQAGRGEVFNVAQGGRCTIRELAETVVRLTASQSKIVYAPERPGDIRHSRAAIDAIVSGLGFAPATSLAVGLEASIAAVQG
ncbi:MAG: NAD-dependent epimerase/dehydratase family protein [Myxococcales bacterium]|nr:NAD-dependent epimerase/dehydratase family protein [Myxococcales bacterium]